MISSPLLSSCVFFSVTVAMYLILLNSGDTLLEFRRFCTLYMFVKSWVIFNFVIMVIEWCIMQLGAFLTYQWHRACLDNL